MTYRQICDRLALLGVWRADLKIPSRYCALRIEVPGTADHLAVYTSLIKDVVPAAVMLTVRQVPGRNWIKGRRKYDYRVHESVKIPAY